LYFSRKRIGLNAMSDVESDAEHDLRVLIDVARRMGETFELTPLLRTIEAAGRSALNCDRATVYLYDPETDELYSKVATGTGELRFSARLGIAGQAAGTRSIIHVPDAYADERFNPAIDRMTGYRTRNMLTLPLLTPAGQVIGVLQVLNKLDGEFEPNDVLLAGALGSLTGIAIKRQMLMDEAAAKQRMERDLNIAREIQQQLLPQENPKLSGFDIAGWNRPAEQTGGDLYDFLPMEDDRLAFMIADATGHGIGPALIVAQCRALLRAVVGTSRDLAAVAGKINNLLCEDLPDGRFVTTCFGVLDTAGRLNYISAGQGPLLLLRAGSSQLERFSATGLPMGILCDTEIELAEPIDLQAGDIFLLMTDGFTEWSRPDGELYGEQRLESLLVARREAPSADIIRAVYDDVVRFGRGSPQMDDLTAVLIKRTP
jgi:phosphoserine phosphatase RsbU/P